VKKWAGERLGGKVAETFGEKDFDAAGGGVDFFADVFGEGDEEFALRGLQSEERRAWLTFAGEVDVADLAEEKGRFGERAGRGSYDGGCGGEFEDGAADEIGDEVAAGGQVGALFPRDADVEAAQFFRVVDGVDALEMEDAHAGMVAVDPEGTERDGTRRASVCGEEEFFLLREPIGKVGEEFGGDFAFVAAGAEDVGDSYECGQEVSLRGFRG